MIVPPEAACPLPDVIQLRMKDDGLVVPIDGFASVAYQIFLASIPYSLQSHKG